MLLKIIQPRAVFCNEQRLKQMKRAIDLSTADPYVVHNNMMKVHMQYSMNAV